MKALVTGSTGFLGSHLCRALAQRGAAVRAFHRNTSSLEALSGVSFESAVGDLLEPGSLPPAVAGMDVVIHCGGLVARWDEQKHMIASHVLGTRYVLQEAMRQHVHRFVHVSSVAALGIPDDRSDGPASPTAPMREDHQWNFDPRLWAYGYAKHLAELEVWKAVAGGLDALVTNPSAVFGAGDIHRRDRSIIAWMATGRVPPIAPPGGLNAVHIDDVVGACLAALERGRSGRRYLITGQNLSHFEFLNLTAEVVGRRPPRWVLPARVFQLAGGLADVLHRWSSAPVRANLLKLSGYNFYYDNSRSAAELSLPAPKPYRLAAQEAFQWFQAHPV